MSRGLRPSINVAAYLRMAERLEQSNIVSPAFLELEAAILEQDEAEKFVREERCAIQNEQIDDSPAAITKYAIQALQEPDTRWGKHSVARAWLREHAERVIGIFRKVPA